MSMQSDFEVSDQIIAEARNWFQDMLRIDSSNPPGNEHRIISYVQNVLSDFNVTSQVFELEKGRTNIVAGRVSDEKSEKGILLTSHADTVPVLNSNDWSQDPFGGIIADGCIWGRGAVDMKFKIAFDLAMMKWAYSNGLNDSISQVVVAGEETGGQFGSQFLCSRHRKALSGRYVINEIGGFPLSLAGRQLLLLQSGEKGHVILQLTLSGAAIHASTPVDSLRLQHVFEGLKVFCEKVESFQMCAGAEFFIEGLGKVLPEAMRPIVENLASADTVAASLKVLSEFDPEVAAQIRAMLFTTCTPTVCNLGSIANILTPSGKVVFDVRLIPGTDIQIFSEKVQQHAASLASEFGFNVQAEILRATEGYELPVSDPLFQHCLSEIEKHWGSNCKNAPAAAFLLPASSDSSHYARAGFIPIGFSPLLFSEDFPGFVLAHGIDERLPVQAFDEGLRLYIRTLGSYLRSFS